MKGPRQKTTRKTATNAGLATRRAATALLSAVLDQRQALDGLIDAAETDSAFNRLDDRDRRLARAIVSTTLRRLGEIEAALDRMIERRPRRAGALIRVLQTAAAQILFMEVADHAAVSIAMEQIGGDRDARHFKGLANAVLRRLVRERDTVLHVVDDVRVIVDGDHLNAFLGEVLGQCHAETAQSDDSYL